MIISTSRYAHSRLLCPRRSASLTSGWTAVFFCLLMFPQGAGATKQVFNAKEAKKREKTKYQKEQCLVVRPHLSSRSRKTEQGPSSCSTDSGPGKEDLGRVSEPEPAIGVSGHQFSTGRKMASVKIDDIKMGERVRGETGPLDGLEKSIRSFGVTKAVVVDQDLNLISGHRTLEAARRAGMKETDVRVLKVEDENSRLELQIADNLHQLELQDPLRLAEAFLKLKKNYERQHPETRRGKTGGGRNGKGTRRKTGSPQCGDPVPCFIDYTAERFGKSKTWLCDRLQLLELPRESLQKVAQAPSKTKMTVAWKELRAWRKARKERKNVGIPHDGGCQFDRGVQEIFQAIELLDAKACAWAQDVEIFASTATKTLILNKMVDVLDRYIRRAAKLRRHIKILLEEAGE